MAALKNSPMYKVLHTGIKFTWWLINAMNNLLYYIAILLIIFWLLGFFVFSLGAIIHVLLVIAVIAILFRVIQGERL